MSDLEGQVCAIGEGEEIRVWRVERLWEVAQDLPIEVVPLNVFERILDEGCWLGADKPTNRMVALRAKQIYDADLAYPIILSAAGMIMDGRHRILKAWLLG